MAMEAKQIKTEETLIAVIEALHDGHKTFAEVGGRLQDDCVKEFFLAESLNWQQFAGDLESELQQLGGERDVQKEGSIGGTTGGAIDRTWGEIKSKLGGADIALLETAEQCEDDAKAAYNKALEEKHLPEFIREILEKQQRHIEISHDWAKELRDTAKAAA